MISRLAKLAIAILFFVGDAIFRLICRLAGKDISPSPAPVLVIITYHSVKASQTTLFEKQMNTLLKLGRPISLGDGITLLSSGYNFAVTFDDAYQSVLQNALPILLEKNIPATIFVPTGCLGGKPTWIKNQSHNYASETVATEEQLKALPTDLITIGSHTVSHINLTNVDESIARREIFESKETLEKVLNQKVTLFAAPYATLNENFTDLFRESGYHRVFLNIPTFPATKTDLYILGRIGVEPSDWPLEYRLKFAGAYQWLPIAINLKEKLIGAI
jgi:peptidoglycan/xylan/chitin deacetylase (PgdA/CDA1 family)